MDRLEAMASGPAEAIARVMRAFLRAAASMFIKVSSLFSTFLLHYSHDYGVVRPIETDPAKRTSPSRPLFDNSSRDVMPPAEKILTQENGLPC